MAHATQIPGVSDPAAWVTDAATRYMQSPANDLGMVAAAEPAFDLPLLGFAAGDDPLWGEYKEHVGEFHWTPAEAFALVYPELPVSPDELTVVSWILPQTEATLKEHTRQAKLPENERLPGERWARARVLGESRVNAGLRRYLIELLHQMGIAAIAPMLLPQWSSKESPRYGFASTWSERHAAYAAGLGTFGLCDGFITPVGKAMRTGSIIARVRIAASPRPYDGHQANCLFFNSGTCGKCIERCPVNALSEQGHDKNRCREFIRDVTRPYVKEQWNLEGYGCGFCQVGVPCTTRIPARPGPAL